MATAMVTLEVMRVDPVFRIQRAMLNGIIKMAFESG
jgi:hypothetical protein